MFLRFLQHGLILLYLAVTCGAFVFTMTRIRLPLPWPMVAWSYGMMAPFQDYQTHNESLAAEGLLADGTRVRIDLDPYFPYLLGEANIRGYLPALRDADRAMPADAYVSLALQLRTLEEKRGRSYERVRLLWEAWPESPAGFSFLRQEPFVTREFLVQAP